MQKKKCLTATDIESQTLIALPDRSLTAIIVPFSDLISAISLILCSCLFLTGFVQKKRSSWSSVGYRKVSNPVKEDVSSHVTELGSQAKLGPDMSISGHARRLQQEADFSPQSPLKTDIKAKGIQPVTLLERQTQAVPDEKAVESKLITLKEAVNTHGVAYETLRSWYRGGYLPEKGREVFHTHGGGKILVDEKDVLRLKSQPPARGKPPNKPKG
jgi:hypothetical protein